MSRDPSGTAAAQEVGFRTLAESIPQLVWMTDAEGRVVWFNGRWYDYTGSTVEQSQGWGWLEFVHPEHVREVAERYRRSLSGAQAWEDTYPVRRADGEYRWFLARALPLRGPGGHIERWVGTDTDVTERIEAERLQQVLGREIGHRVKNSLALVSSLLTMQARGMEGSVRQALRDAAMRVNTVARLHDLLWRGTQARVADLTELTRTLCEGLRATSPRHELIVHADPAQVGVDVALPVALVLNELVTNAFKHAYGERGGPVEVGLRRTPEGLRLEVRDRGIGLPQGFDPALARDSLGMKVVTTLTAQLQASLEASTADPGARFVLLIPLAGTDRQASSQAAG